MGSATSHSHTGDVDRSITDSLHRQVLLAGMLSSGGEFCYRTTRRRFGHLPARIRINLGIEHQDVDVHPGAQNVIKSAGADVIGPAIAADQPDTLTHERVADHQ